MDATGHALVQFWVDVGERGLMNSNTAGSYRSACEAILSALPNWQDLDMRRLNLAQTLGESRRKLSRYLSESTMRTYESNFKKAVPSFVSYLEDPNGWSPPVRPRRSTTLSTGTALGSSRQSNAADLPAEPQHSAPIDLPIPLTDGRTARLTLPPGLTRDDVQLLEDIIPVYLKRIPVRGK